MDKIPLIAHVIHRLQVGGLENGLINLVNNLPRDKYRHVIICMTESSDFAKRIHSDDINIYTLHKKDGKNPGVYWRLWKLLRQLKPAIVHSRNIATLETPVVAALAGVPIRVHGEHGRDIFDLHGNNKKYQRLRQWVSPFTHRFVPMSKDLENWLHAIVGIPKEKIAQLYNGVNTEIFYPAGKEKRQSKSMPAGFADEESIVIGTVGRLEPVKDQLTLLRAFFQLWQNAHIQKEQLRLVLLGDGSLRPKIEQLVAEARAEKIVWLAGNRNDIPAILREMDIFVLPSLGEGISNTILEAMASGLPVVATKVGGNAELVMEGVTGALICEDAPSLLAAALRPYLMDKNLRHSHGQAGRRRVEEVFSLSAMLRRYESIYDELLDIKLENK